MILMGKDGPFELRLELRQALYVRYQHLGIDVQAELYKAALWLEKNPSRRPKKMIRFLETWIRKCKGGAPHRKAGVSAQAGVSGDAGNRTLHSPPPSTPSPAPVAAQQEASVTSLALASLATAPATRINGPQELSAVFARMRLIVNHRSVK